MEYKSYKIGERLVFAPDKELKTLLRQRLVELKATDRSLIHPFIVEPVYTGKHDISVFGHRHGLRRFLAGHVGNRIFITVDFVHAFHQVGRDMIATLFPRIANPFFDACFVELSGQNIIPIGFPTSNFIFEIFASRKFDTQLADWQNKHAGVVTRYTDNILATWRKNTKESFEDLQKIFEGFQVRFTPKEPRKWEEPIRFCGITIPRRGRPHLSNLKTRKLLYEARKKSLDALDGAQRFVDEWSQ